MESYSESYRKSGVDITAGYAGVKLMAPHVARTRIPGVVSGIGGFGGLFAPDLTGIREPVLVSGTDGVGTKIRIAQLLDQMCIRDRRRSSARCPPPARPHTRRRDIHRWRYPGPGGECSPRIAGPAPWDGGGATRCPPWCPPGGCSGCGSAGPLPRRWPVRPSRSRRSWTGCISG